MYACMCAHKITRTAPHTDTDTHTHTHTQHTHRYDRADYLDRLIKDLATLYGYVPFLINLFLQLFPPAEAIEFLQAQFSMILFLCIRFSSFVFPLLTLTETMGGLASSNCFFFCRKMPKKKCWMPACRHTESENSC